MSAKTTSKCNNLPPTETSSFPHVHGSTGSTGARRKRDVSDRFRLIVCFLSKFFLLLVTSQIVASLMFVHIFGAVYYVALADGSVFGRGAAPDAAARFGYDSILALFAGLDAGLMAPLLTWHVALIGHDVTSVRSPTFPSVGNEHASISLTL